MQVPIFCYLVTHAYFTFYFSFTNIVLRRIRTSMRPGTSRVVWLTIAVFALSYFTAFMETLTIAAYPHYTFVDRNRMYTIGSIVYALYFVVGFPMFLLFDEDSAKATTWDAVRDSCAAAMLVTCLLDFWRLLLGGIVDKIPAGLPWMPTGTA